MMKTYTILVKYNEKEDYTPLESFKAKDDVSAYYKLLDVFLEHQESISKIKIEEDYL